MGSFSILDKCLLSPKQSVYARALESHQVLQRPPALGVGVLTGPAALALLRGGVLLFRLDAHLLDDLVIKRFVELGALVNDGGLLDVAGEQVALGVRVGFGQLQRLPAQTSLGGAVMEALEEQEALGEDALEDDKHAREHTEQWSFPVI